MPKEHNERGPDDCLAHAFVQLAHAITHLSRELGNQTILQRLEKIERILMTQAELAVLLDGKTTQLVKVAKEQSDRFDALTLRIEELTKVINDGGDVSPAVAGALTNLETALDSLDAAIPDAPTVPV